MNMKQKLCFTIMGFGKKTDYSTGRTYDLDKTYLNIIKPAVENAGYISIRADEIQDSSLIDKSMYALLIKAELVIADITTLNPNALYELGIRHAARPNYTIILKDKDGKIPFDLDHNRFIIYTHLGDDVGATEAKECQERLLNLITDIEKQKPVDSPLFTFLEGLNPHQISQTDYDQIISKLSEKEGHVFAVSEKAKLLMTKNDFADAALLWEKASSLLPDEHYFIQQHALCTYKSELPSKETSLLSALTILSKIYNQEDTNDPETLGLAGAIYKRIYSTTSDIETLKSSINAYKRGYIISGDYYTGENYASCLDVLSNASADVEEQVYCKYQSKTIRKEIISDITKKLFLDDTSQDKKWMYATLANCHFHLGNITDAETNEQLFLSSSPEGWEIETYQQHKPKPQI